MALDKIAPESSSITTPEDFDALFENLLPSDEPRYVLLKLNYESSDNIERCASAFILHCPGACKVRQKMMATMFLKPVHMQVAGGTSVPTMGPDNFNYGNILASILSKKTVR